MARIERWIGIGLSAALFWNTAEAQVTERVSVDSAGHPALGFSGIPSMSSSISADGRFVVFVSDATNLVSGDTNGQQDVFVHDRQSGATILVSATPSGGVGNGWSWIPSISADGRFVVFQSMASDLVPGPAGGSFEVFVRDLLNGTTEWVSATSMGGQADSYCLEASISGDGRYVTFESPATNLLPGVTSGSTHIYMRDRQSGALTLVSVGLGGVDIDGEALWSIISADGAFVSFVSDATNLVAGSPSGQYSIFVRDIQNGTNERASVDSTGLPGIGQSWMSTISATGRFVAFSSEAANLVSGDSNGFQDVFVHDRQTGATERVSVDSSGIEGDLESGDGVNLSISPDGRFVAFSSSATNLAPGGNGGGSIYVRDRLQGSTERVSVNFGGAPPDGPSYFLSLSADGRYVAFESAARNLVPGGFGVIDQVYVRDRLPGSGSTPFTSLCDPANAGVISCPCGNPPNGPSRGCDNSDATGGAALSAFGGANVTADGISFTTTGEVSTGLSVLVQGNAQVAGGVVYGQGVRCVGGALKRLYTKTASGGGISAPDFGAGDPTVSVRSAARGDTIHPGQTRWYFVYYRDPIVLGGCSAGSTFNATQSGQVAWSL